MANQLKMDMVNAILTLKQRGWSQRRIARELGINRETVAKYINLPDAGPKPATNAPTGWEDSKPASNAPTGFVDQDTQKPGPESQCEPYRKVVEDKLQSGLSRQRIYHDLLRLIESWGQDDPAVDLAPAPFGDGVVDTLDLELLMSYWGQPIDDPTLIAHWALDETEGDVAYDSIGVNDAFVIGGTAWQPIGGLVEGALQLDGIDGCAVAGPALNPSDGPFSVFAWIKGGLPGQVVLSQQGVANWLILDADGNLMTELMDTGRSGNPLQSQTIITDGFWHRLGFVWDGFNRALYVDDILVAENTQDGLESSNNGMYIGTGKLMTPGTYWSGLIDEVRIYSRAVSP